jgi:hypothetical protein
MSAKGLLGIAKKLMNLLAFRAHIHFSTLLGDNLN